MPHRSVQVTTTGPKLRQPPFLLQRLQNLVRQVPVVLFQCQYTKDGSLAVAFFSDGLKATLGMHPTEAISSPRAVLRSILPQDREGVLLSMKSAVNGPVWSREFRIVLQDEVRWVEAEAAVEQVRGGYIYNGFARDITERKVLDLKLREAQEELLRMVEDRTGSLTRTNSELQKLNKEIKSEISERIVLEKKLRESYELLSLLAADLVQSEERERRRIATELHDDVVQYLALGKLRIDMSSQKSAPHPDLLKALVDLIANAIKQIRKICNDLSPPLLYDYGLVEAVENLGLRLAKEHCFELELRGKVPKGLLTDHVRTVLYQAARELLANVVKHAQAKRVRVQFRRRANMVYLIVMDDGVGMTSSSGTGFGLSHVRQRIAFLNGTVRFSSSPGWSSVVTAAVPVTG